MQPIGIVTEANPWHYGHQWLVNSVRQQLDPEAIIGIMSGHFTQRGEPAITDKWLRTQMALAAGIDLIIELPVHFAVRSSGFFAHGAIKLLSLAGAQALAFSCEHPQLDLLKEIAGYLNDEPFAYRQAVKANLKSGASLAQARADALVATCYHDDPHIATILSSPNDILAISYLQELEKLHWPLAPIAFQRQGSGYHSLTTSHFSSAAAIRNCIYTGKINDLDSLLPPKSAELLKQALQNRLAPPHMDNYFQLMLYKLRTSSSATLQSISEMEAGLENRLLKAARQATNYNDFISTLKTKRYPYTRLQRLLFYVLFDIKAGQVASLDAKTNEYLRILGCSTTGAAWLKQLNIKAELVLRRGRDLRTLLRGNNALLSQQLSLDIKASAVYDLLHPAGHMNHSEKDFTQPVFFKPGS